MTFQLIVSIKSVQYYTVKQKWPYLNEIMNEGGNEHGIQFDVHVLQDIVERPLGAVLGDQGDRVQVPCKYRLS